MDFKNGLSVTELTGFSGIEKSAFRNVVYADYMMMVLSDVQRIAIGVLVCFLVVLSVLGNVATLWVNTRR